MNKKKPYFVYILRCCDKTFYTGITTGLKRRIKEHNTGKGAKYTAIRAPVKCIYWETSKNRSTATIREREIKRYPRTKKWKLVRSRWKIRKKKLKI
ncbi:MAG: GIY-YIG nuclease family protein [Elusimicrobia bacterium]|nr:GIY-YIG nuclease family protein [Elusimicrobiota bacterium]